MNILRLTQGTPEWHAHRSQSLNASDAPAMMACSPYKTRAELVRELASGLVPEVTPHMQELFDKGHLFEALYRAQIAEGIVGEALFPIVGANGKYSASFDGITMMCDEALEHKTLNSALREAMTPDCTGTDLPMVYQIQMEHQCMVSKETKRVLFGASEWKLEADSGEWVLVEERHCWYTPSPELRAKIVAGWELLEQDVAAYVAPTAEMPEAKIHAALPALKIDVRGEVTASNMDEFKAVVLERINGISTSLVTDADFADADTDAKFLRDVSDRMKLAAKAVRGNMQTVDDVLTMLEQLDKIATQKAIDLEKKVKTEKETRKEKIVTDAEVALAAHIAGLNAMLGASYIATLRGTFAPAIKGLKSLQSMEDKVRAALAGATSEADATAARLAANRAHLKQDDADWITVFADFATVGQKVAEDFQALAALRIGNQKRADDERQEKLRLDGLAKAAALDAQQAQAAIETVAPAAEPVQAPAPVPVVANVVPMRAAPAQVAPSTAPSLKLGQIAERLAPISLTADGLAALGFKHAATAGASKLYHEADFPLICAALVRHIEAVQSKAAA